MKQNSPQPLSSPEESLLYLAIKFKNCRATVLNRKLDFDSMYHRLMEAVAWADQQGAPELSRFTFDTWLQRTFPQMTPAERVSQIAVYGRISLKAMLKPDDMPGLLLRLDDEQKSKQTQKAVQLLNAGQIEDGLAELAAAKPEQADELRAKYAAAGKLPPEPDPFADITRVEIPALPKAVDAVISNLMAATNEPFSIKHLLVAISVLSAACGKQVMFFNRGRYYYTNLSIVILGKSGSNKTGLAASTYRVMEACGIDAKKWSTTTSEAFLDYYGEIISKEKGEERRRLTVEICSQQRANSSGIFCLVDEFRAFIKTFVPDNDSIRKGQLFCSLVENEDIFTATKTNGSYVLADPCISFLGFSQTDAFNGEMRSVQFQQGGLAGRLIPVNCERLDADYAPEDQSLDDVKNVIQWLKYSPSKVNVIFGDSPDPLGESKKRLRTHPLVQYVMKDMPEMYETLESKILIQGAKIAAVLAAAETVEKTAIDDNPFSAGENEAPPEIKEINAGKWLDFGLSLAALAHLSNAYHIVEQTEESEKIQKIKHLIKRKGEMSKRDIAKYANMQPYQIQQYISALVDSGEIVEITSKGGRTKVFRVVK